MSDEDLTRLAAQVAVERERVRALVALVLRDEARAEVERLRAQNGGTHEVR